MTSTQPHFSRMQTTVFAVLCTAIVVGVAGYTWSTMTTLEQEWAQVQQREKILMQKKFSYQTNTALMASLNVGSSGLQRIEIRPRSEADLTIHPFETVRLTSVGIFSSLEQAIYARWFANNVPISGCSDTTTCDYVASERGGEVDVRAESEGLRDAVTVFVKHAAAPSFPDVAGVISWATHIPRLAELGIFRGQEDGTFNPGGHLTHGQAVTLFYRILKHAGLASDPSSCSAYVTGVGPDHYAYLPVCLAVRLSLIHI